MRPAMQASLARPCPTPSVLVDLAARGLGQSGDAGLEDHVSSCAACRAALVALVAPGSAEQSIWLGSGFGPAGQALDTPPPSSGGPRRRWLSEGDTVGRYRIVRMLGKGGMGVVYEALDPKLRRAVALKLLLPRAAVTEERLLREAQALALLNHPNVVTVFDAGADACGVFVAMELVPGPTLRGYLAAPERTREQVLRAFLAAGRGLLAAHEQGLVHRDFKPDNVLVGQGPRFLVTDFGLAVAPSAGEAESDGAAPAPASEGDLLARSLTRSGYRVGTPAYMAPEQRDGGAVDARADQYAFALALTEAMTGRYPLPVPPAEDSVDLESKRFALGPSLEATLRRALAREREQRFDSLSPVLSALEAELAPPRSRRALWGLAAVLVALLIGFGVWRVARGTGSASNRSAQHAAAAPTIAAASVEATPAPAIASSAAPTTTASVAPTASAPATLSPLVCDPARHPGPCPPYVRYVDPAGRFAAVFVGPPMIEKHGPEASPAGTQNIPTLFVSMDGTHTMSLITVDTANLHGLDCTSAVPVLAANLAGFLDDCRVSHEEPIRQGKFDGRRYTVTCPKKPRTSGEVRILCDPRDIASDRLHVYRLQTIVEGDTGQGDLALIMNGLEIY